MHVEDKNCILIFVFLLEIEYAANLFGCSTEQLVNILITRTVQSATDKVTTHLSKSDVRSFLPYIIFLVNLKEMYVPLEISNAFNSVHLTKVCPIRIFFFDD